MEDHFIYHVVSRDFVVLPLGRPSSRSMCGGWTCTTREKVVTRSIRC